MSGNDVAGILHPETAFDRGFKEIAELRNNRQDRAQRQQPGSLAEIQDGEARGDDETCNKTSDGARPGLLRADAWPEFRSANAPAREISADIGHPNNQENKDQRHEAVPGIETHQNRRRLRRGGIEKPAGYPAAPRLPYYFYDQHADQQHDECSVDPARDETKSGGRKCYDARDDHAPLAPSYDRQPLDIEPDRDQRYQRAPQPAAGLRDRNCQWCEHCRGGDAQKQITRTLPGRCGFALAHDPVFAAARPPKRRSRRPYSAIALSSA